MGEITKWGNRITTRGCCTNQNWEKPWKMIGSDDGCVCYGTSGTFLGLQPPPFPGQKTSITDMIMVTYIQAILLVFGVLSNVVPTNGTAQKEPPLGDYYGSIAKGLQGVRQVVDPWAGARALPGATHYHRSGLDPAGVFTCWLIQIDTIQRYFSHGKCAGQMKAQLWLHLGQDLASLWKRTLSNEFPEYRQTRFYLDLMDTVLGRLKPSSLAVFTSLDRADARLSAIIGTLEQDGQKQTCVYDRSASSENGAHSPLLNRNLALWRDMYGEGINTVHAVVLGFPLASHGDHRPWDQNERIGFYRLHDGHRPYTFLCDWVKTHPGLGVSLIRDIAGQVIRTLLTCHDRKIVYNADLSRSVIIQKTEGGAARERPAIDRASLHNLRLFPFMHAFKTEGNEYAYAELKADPSYRPEYPPPEEVDLDLDRSDPTLADSWYMGLLMIELHLGTPFWAYYGMGGRNALQAFYLILLGAPSLDQETILRKLGELGHHGSEEEIATRLGWYNVINANARSFSLWDFLEDRLDPYALELVRGLLAYDPKRRLTLAQALEHVYFNNQMWTKMRAKLSKGLRSSLKKLFG